MEAPLLPCGRTPKSLQTYRSLISAPSTGAATVQTAQRPDPDRRDPAFRRRDEMVGSVNRALVQRAGPGRPYPDAASGSARARPIALHASSARAAAGRA